MAVLSGLTFGSFLVLTFVCIGAMQRFDQSADIGGVYPIERKRSSSQTKSESSEYAASPNNIQDIPMIVPKRAALLLDRLMVALHHALEEERNGHRRLSDIYGRERTPSFLLEGGSLADFDPTEHDNMYSDEEEPDYDLRSLRDLKSANRGSGETLMAKSFQRRTPNDEDAPSGRSNGRKYWRCYFNAVSCF